MSDKPLISVVVPIYNVEQYLKRCVDSIRCQTYSNLEIVLVNDGSTDNCGKICDDYQKKDNRIKVIHKKNGGLSDARNVGIKIVHGEKNWGNVSGIQPAFLEEEFLNIFLMQKLSL